jgi:hypothetical protein
VGAAAPDEMTVGPAVARRVDAARDSSLGGLSNSEIAKEVFVSASIAKVHHVPVIQSLA